MLLPIDELNAKLKEYFADKTEDSDLAIMADISDTVTGLVEGQIEDKTEEVEKLTADLNNLQALYDQLKADYHDRFFAGEEKPESEEEKEPETDPEDLKIEDLFTEKE